MDGAPYSSDDDEEVENDSAILGLGVWATAMCHPHMLLAACPLVQLEDRADHRL